MPIPIELGSVTEGLFRISWSDGHHSTYTWRSLRAGCPCAACKGEWGATRPQVQIQNIPSTIRAMSVTRIGAYALRFVWSDSHSTGIYPFALLRSELCECPECSAKRTSSV